jgi:hypothetical protein
MMVLALSTLNLSSRYVRDVHCDLLLSVVEMSVLYLSADALKTFIGNESGPVA